MFRLYTVKPVKNKERKNLGCPSAWCNEQAFKICVVLRQKNEVASP